MFSSGKHDHLTADTRPFMLAFGGTRLTREDAYWEMRVVGYDPRPEFDRPLTNPANPILAAFRNLWAGQPDVLEMAEYTPEEIQWGRKSDVKYARDATPDQIEHARKVLYRLANLNGE